MRYFIVNQKKTYKLESTEGYVWAPILDRQGYKKSFWDSLLKVNKGDIILSNISGKIVSFNIALSTCYDYDSPFSDDLWEKRGRKIDVEYHELKSPINYSSFIDELLILQKKNGAFNKSKRINQGYLFQLTKEQFDLLFKQVKDPEIKFIFADLYNLDIKNDIEEMVVENHQADKIYSGEVVSYTEQELLELNEKRKTAKPQRLNATSRRFSTNEKLRATCLELHDYKCEISSDHKTFVNASGKHDYVECHHLIPMKAQADFPDLWLDDLFNLVSLCPTCHARIHYGSKEEKEFVFWTIFNERKKTFKEKGFDKGKMQEIFDEYY